MKRAVALIALLAFAGCDEEKPHAPAFGDVYCVVVDVMGELCPEWRSQENDDVPGQHSGQYSAGCYSAAFTVAEGRYKNGLLAPDLEFLSPNSDDCLE